MSFHEGDHLWFVLATMKRRGQQHSAVAAEVNNAGFLANVDDIRLDAASPRNLGRPQSYAYGPLGSLYHRSPVHNSFSRDHIPRIGMKTHVSKDRFESPARLCFVAADSVE